MCATFEKFEEGGYEFEPATKDIEHFNEKKTDAMRFYMNRNGKFIGYLDLFTLKDSNRFVWRFLENRKKCGMSAICESQSSIKTSVLT